MKDIYTLLMTLMKVYIQIVFAPTVIKSDETSSYVLQFSHGLNHPCCNRNANALWPPCLESSGPRWTEHVCNCISPPCPIG